MTRVMHVTGGLNVGGVEMGLLHLVQRLDPKEIQTTIYCLQMKDALAEDIRSHGAKIVFCPHTGNPLQTCLKLYRYLADHPQDVIHAHTLFFSGWLMLTGALAGIPIRLAQAHTTQDKVKARNVQPIYHGLMRFLINRFSTERLAVSEDASKFLFGTGMAPEGKVQSVPAGVDCLAYLSHGKDPELKSELGIPPSSLVIGNVGNLRDPKNHSFLLDVARAMLSTRSDLHFVFAGEGDLREELEQKSQRLGISQNVSFLGTRMDVPELMTGLFHLFLFPSLNEGMGQVMIQAQASGLPVLASSSLPREVEIVPELMNWMDLKSGPDAWADKSLELLAAPPFDALAANQAAASSRFYIDHTIGQLRALYRGETLK